MTDQTTVEPEEQHAEEMDLLRGVLMPLGEDRLNKIMALVSEYLEEVSPLTWCAGQSEPGEEATAVVWEIGAPSPLNAERTVFALFYDPDMRAVVAYSFMAIKIEGREGALATYHREHIYRPRYGAGPIALAALFNDLEFHLTRDQLDLEPPKRMNGGG